jgi:hypothetical protein
MQNMIQLQDDLKNFSEQQLVREMQMPSGQVPQFLILTELGRRKRMKDDFSRQQAAGTPTVAEETVATAGMPVGASTDMAKAMAPKTSMTENTGIGTMMPKQPTRMAEGGDVEPKNRFEMLMAYLRSLREKEEEPKPTSTGPSIAEMINFGGDYEPVKKAEGGVVKMRTGGTMSAIASLKVNYPEVYKKAVEDGNVEEMAAIFAESAKEPELTALEQLEAPRSFDTLQNLFTDPSNRAVTKKQREIEAAQPEQAIQAQIETQQRLRELADDDPIFAEGSVVEQIKGTPKDGFPRKTEVPVIEGSLGAPEAPVISLPSATSSQSFVPQRPPGAAFSEPSVGADLIPFIEDSTFVSKAPSSSVGDVYADPDKVRAAQEAVTTGVGTVGGPITLEEAVAEAEKQRKDEPTSSQIEQPMLVDQQATASIPEGPNMETELRDARVADLIGSKMSADNTFAVPDGVSKTLVDAGADLIEGVGGVVSDAAQKGSDMAIGTKADRSSEVVLGTGAQIIDPATTQKAQMDADKAALDAMVAGTTGTSGKSGSGSKGSGAGGGLEGQLADMLKDMEKSREQDKWLALANTGLALMASKQPTLGGALGEAGMAGMKQLREGKQQYSKDKMTILALQQRIDASKRAAASKSSGLSASQSLTRGLAILKQGQDMMEDAQLNKDPMAVERAQQLINYGNALMGIPNISSTGTGAIKAPSAS